VGIADRRVEYETHGLDLADLAVDPIAQWHRWYDDAVAAEVVEPNAMVVSTIGTDGLPDARWVLVRAVDDLGFAFYTNFASVKGRQLAAAPRAAVTFGWLELHRQVRARGWVQPVEDAEADAYFASRPRGSQIGAWASAQSAEIADRSVLEAQVAEVERRFAGTEVARPAGWGGYRVVPDAVEFWQGRPSRLHDRLCYRRGPSGGWTVVRLSP